jgi:hypothetical protein
VIRRAPVVLLLFLACTHPAADTRRPAQEASILDDGDSMMGTPACAEGAFIPGAQEVPAYLTCASDADCVHVAAPSCCTSIHFAVNRAHVCVIDLGSSCDMVCDDDNRTHPPGAAAWRAVCADGRCALRP